MVGAILPVAKEIIVTKVNSLLKSSLKLTMGNTALTDTDLEIWFPSSSSQCTA